MTDPARHPGSTDHLAEDLLKAAHEYVARGWAVFPVNPDKSPMTKHGFHDATTDTAQIDNWWKQQPRAGIGVPTGAKTFLVLDVDPRNGGAESFDQLVADQGPLPHTVGSLTGGGGNHYFFLCPSGARCRTNWLPGIDIKAEGGYVVMPPSSHLSGGTYGWELSSSPSDVELTAFPFAAQLGVGSGNVEGFVVEPLLDDGPAKQGSRNTKLARLAGKWISEGLILELVLNKALEWNSGNPELLSVVEVKRTVVSIWRTNTRNRAIEQVAVTEAKHVEDPVPLDARQSNLPSLPEGVFTGWLGDMIGEVAVATETPRELGAALALGVVAVAVQGRFQVSPKTGYVEPLCLWLVPAMESGNRKSAVLRAMTGPLREWERDQASVQAPEIEKAKAIKKATKARISRLVSESAKSADAERSRLEKEIARLQMGIPSQPNLPRLFTGDCTPEQLVALSFEHGERIAVISSEGGIVEMMAGRYSHSIPNIDAYLQGHSGDFVRVDRRTGPPIVLDSPVLTLVLSPQPGVLRDLASHQTFRSRGLLARFLFLLPESRIGHRTGDTKPVSSHTQSWYSGCIKALLNHPPAAGNEVCHEPATLVMDPEAYELWHEMFLRTERDQRPGGRFEHLRDWAGKLPGAVARIAGLLRLADVIDLGPTGDIGDDKLRIPAAVVKRAIRFSDFLIEHQLAVSQMAGADPNVVGARQVLAWLQREGIEEFSERDAFNSLRGSFGTMGMLRPAIVLLENHGYILRLQRVHRGRGRPPSPRFEVHPGARSEPTRAAQNAQDEQNVAAEEDSVDSADSARGDHVDERNSSNEEESS